MRFVLSISVAALVAACGDTALPVTDGRITTEQQFMDTVAGKSAANQLAEVSIHRDGRVTGVSDGQPFAGTWEWRDGFWCRTITEPVAVPEDCQVWEIRDGLLIITRDRGQGSQLRYTLPQG
jgi:hypothetical protein